MTQINQPQPPSSQVHTKVRLQRLEERHGESTAYLTYSLGGSNEFTLWHTEVPPEMRHSGVGGRLVEQAFGLAESSERELRIVCPFAIDYLAQHPELKESNHTLRFAKFGEAA